MKRNPPLDSQSASGEEPREDPHDEAGHEGDGEQDELDCKQREYTNGVSGARGCGEQQGAERCVRWRAVLLL